ncbi:MAG: hypothetical protein HY974_01765 [Candidatus Kerfeldbacteria bacterium]|nr:hypothetical protein [Candidatus Kerfeldbacteria bacterium]
MYHLTQSASCCAESTPQASPESKTVSADPTTMPSEKVEAAEPIRSEGVISFQVSRQAIMVVALILLAAMAVLETVELWQVRRALTLWQKLPAVQSNVISAPTSNGGANSLPSQVGGC